MYTTYNVAGNYPVAECADYTSSKAALKMVAKSFALEEASKGVSPDDRIQSE